MITLIILYFIDKKRDLSLGSFNFIFLIGFFELLIESAALLSATNLIDILESRSSINQLIKTIDHTLLPQYWARVLMKGDI